MTLSLPRAAKSIGMTVSMFNKHVAQLHMIPVAWKAGRGHSTTRRMAMYSKEQCDMIRRTHLAEVKSVFERMESKRAE